MDCTNEFTLPKELLLGSATAPTQIEGGDPNCNWHAWSLAGKVGKGESSLTGADHWNRWQEDVKILTSLNQECYRMGIEWSRLEPQEGHWSADGLEHYRQEISLLRQKGIAVLITLHHFSCPQWFQDRGAWISEDAVPTFLRFVEHAVTNLGDLVGDWCTINEPNVFANDTYMDGKYPPGDQGQIGKYFQAARNLILAHLDSYVLIHRIRRERNFPAPTRVGFAHHVAVFEAMPGHPLAGLGRNLQDRLFHELFWQGFVEGKLAFPLGKGYPRGKGPFCDWIGVNYYSRHLFQGSWNPARLFAIPITDPSVSQDRLNDLGWEIYPEGLFQVVKPAWERWKLPIWITENGVPDSADTKRQNFLAAHLWQLKRLIDAGVRVERYFHWSFLDNLEWNDGYGPRFGLVEVNYATMERSPRQSALAYAEWCKTHRIPTPTFQHDDPGKASTQERGDRT